MAGNQSSLPPGMAPSIQPSLNQRRSNELQPTPKPRFVRPGSNNPWMYEGGEWSFMVFLIVHIYEDQYRRNDEYMMEVKYIT
jgi:hypothetical protein